MPSSQSTRSLFVDIRIAIAVLYVILPGLLNTQAARAQDASDDAPRVLILIQTNIRAEPSMNGQIVGRAAAGASYLVVDEEMNCAWLKIVTLDNSPPQPARWITGNSAYVQMEAACDAIHALSAPAIVLPTPTVDSSTANAGGATYLIVQMEGVAIRAGPGAAYSVQRNASLGEKLPVVGQVEGCRWLKILDTNDEPGWLSGNIAYSQLVGACEQLPDLELPTPTPTPAPRLTVLIDNVNVRSAASTQSQILQKAALDEVFVVTGQTGDCAWLQIALRGDEVGWISGNQAYTTLDGSCALIPAIAPTPTPRPTPIRPRGAQGCATVTNYLGFTVRIEVKRSDGWQTSFSLSPNASRFSCVDAGTYIATLTSPSRSDRFSVPLFVTGGENYNIPLRMP